MAECLIGLGSNLGDRAAQLAEACRLLCGHPQIERLESSTHHRTRPVGGPADQEMFLNAALRIRTSLAPHDLLRVVHGIEQQLGRERRQRWGPRAIDIDVLLYDERVEESGDLVLPHPRMAVRRFVLAPACEIAADMVHPTTGWTLGTLLRRLDEPPRWVAIAGTDAGQTAQLAASVVAATGARLLRDPAPSLPRTAEESDIARRELRAIAARREQLQGLAQQPLDSSAGWHVCDYWFPQSAALARAWLSNPAHDQVLAACAAASAAVPVPQCVLHLAGPSPGAAAGSMRFERQLARQLAQPHQGPVLHIARGDLALARTELTAAIDAMR